MPPKVNYTGAEKQLFLDCLTREKNLIENKKTDAVANQEKENAWSRICETFNSSAVVCQQRTIPQLKKWWSNIKHAQRDAKTAERQSAMATGGGPPAAPAVLDPQVEAIAPHLMNSAPCLFTSNNKENEPEASSVVFGDSLHDVNETVANEEHEEIEVYQTNPSELEAGSSHHSGTKRTLAQTTGAEKKKSRFGSTDDPRVLLSLEHMKEVQAIKIRHMEEEFRRKELHEQRMEEVKYNTALVTLEIEQEKLRQLKALEGNLIF